MDSACLGVEGPREKTEEPIPEPSFIHRQFDGEVTSIGIVHFVQGIRLLVGTAKGIVDMYDVNTHERIDRLFVDKESRPISSVGGLSLSNLVWIYVRTFGLVILRESSTKGKYKPDLRVETFHYGYCNAISLGMKICIPTNGPYLMIWFMDKQTKKVDLISRGSPMAMCLFDGFPCVAGEDGSVTVYRWTEATHPTVKIDLFNGPCFSVGVLERGMLVAGSSIPPLKLIRMENYEFRQLAEIQYPPEALGCGSISSSPTGHRFACGFWDGSIRVYSLKSLSLCLCIPPQLRSRSVSCLVWFNNFTQRTLYATSSENSLFCYKI